MLFENTNSKKKRLLKELDSLGYDDRIKHISLLAHKTNKNDFRKLLFSLLDDGQYEGNLALAGAEAIKDCEVIKKALNHNKNSIKIKASKLLAKYGTIDEIEKVITSLSYECRKRLLNTISINNRKDAAEKLFKIVYSKYGAREAKRIFAICSDETVEKYIDEIEHSINNWSKIAVYHEELFMKHFKKRLKEAKDRDRLYVWNRFSDGIKVLVSSNEEFVLDCIIEFPPMTNLLYGVLRKQYGILVRKNPSKVKQILLLDECRNELLLSGIPNCILKSKTNFNINDWIEIGTIIKDKYNHIEEILKCLPPSKREEFFIGVYGDEIKKRIFTSEILKFLPFSLRDKIAQNMLTFKEIYNDKNKYLDILSYSSIKYNRAILEKEVKSSNAEERAVALQLIIKSTALSKMEVSETLTYLSRIKNDQDPVKCAVVKELSSCNASIFKDEHVKLLEVITNSIIDSNDTSYGTLYNLEHFAFNILKYNAENTESEIFIFSLNVLLSISKRNTTVMLPNLDNIKNGLEKIIFDSFYPLLQDCIKQENYNSTLKMAQLLGKRGYEIEKLQELLRTVVMCKYESYSRQAVKYYLGFKKTRDKRVGELLSLDKSFISIQEVFSHLHRKRQEWLDSYIDGSIISGKFLSGDTIYLVPAVDGFNKYLPRQQEKFSLLLKKMSVGTKYSYYSRNSAIHAASKMPDLDLGFFTDIIKSNEELISNAGLHAVSLTEEPEKSIKILLNFLDGDKAKVAMYAIPRVIRNMSPKSFSQVINDLFKKEYLKITVRKECIRLLGEYRSEENIKLLLNESNKENIQKDVQIAIGHATRKYLDYEFSWKILDNLIANDEPDVLKSLLREYPSNIQNKYKNKYLDLILKLANSHNKEVSKEALISLKYWLSVNEDNISLVASKIIIDLNDCSRLKQAIDLLMYAAQNGNINKYVLDTVKYLCNVKVTEDINAQFQRDMPNRQRLYMIINELTSLNKTTKEKLIPLFIEIIDVLKSDKTLMKMCIKLYVSCIDFKDADNIKKYINCISEILKEMKYLMEFSYKEIYNELNNSKGYYDPEILITSINEIISENVAESMYLSLSLLEKAGHDLLWREDCAAALRIFRNNDNIEISSKALDIWTSIE